MMDSQLVKDIVYEINRISSSLKLRPSELKKSLFLAECEEKFTEWDLRKVGGYATLIKAYFTDSDKDLRAIQIHEQQAARINKLEKVVGNREAYVEQLTKSVGREMERLKIQPVVLNPKATKDFLRSLCKVDKKYSKKEDLETRSIVTIWSDQHFGTNVDKEELGGKNEYSWTIGARRLGMLCEQIATYKIEDRVLHQELIILLLGDNIAGVIHSQEGPGNDLLTFQLCGAQFYYTQAIMYLKQFFPKIRVICQPGNHGRMMHKVSKDRALQNKYDSHENEIFFALSNKFAGDPQVAFEITRAPFSDVTIQGHRIYATHGDTVFDTGNPGKVVNLGKIEGQILKINADELARSKPAYELFCTGHVHHPLISHVGPKIGVIINGCLVGTDAFAHSVGIHSNTPTQVLWETTPSFVVGDIRQIYVEKADVEAQYETIIKPYRYQLSFEM